MDPYDLNYCMKPTRMFGTPLQSALERLPDSFNEVLSILEESPESVLENPSEYLKVSKKYIYVHEKITKLLESS